MTAVPKEWRWCPCGCCVERVDFITHGRRDSGCHCEAHPPDERCDCVGCTRDKEAIRD